MYSWTIFPEDLVENLCWLGEMAELFQLTRAQLVQLQLIVGAQDHDHMGGGNHRGSGSFGALALTRPVWCGGGDKRVLGDDVVYVEAEVVPDGVAGSLQQ